ncbi:hypothetical protein D3Z53_15675 [Lachnospiraceae bacterium]|jgi:anaerobic ribonucleoside-triphosphate reductase activating protein|nr:hypothetical protein [uncultured Schaedlerella sp.]NBI59464.1 hypothetical protein [Lachnospiraceae bacterium]
MLRYIEFGLSHIEVPGEAALCIYISGCQNHCPDCHYPELQSPYEGEILKIYFDSILDLYCTQTTCICFMGEGEDSEDTRQELVSYTKRSHSRGFKCCLYSGKDTNIETWMQAFDYIKTGSYKKEQGALNSRTTNQRMYEKVDDIYIDITNIFWKER